MTPIEFFVPGTPETAGSKRTFIMKIKDRPGTSAKDYRAIVTDDNPRGEKWKKKCAAMARVAHQGQPLTGPLQLDVTFILARPIGHFGTGKNAGVLKPGAPQYPTVRPDATKLLRCIEDGLTGVLWADDATIVAQHVFKEYGPTEGARVAVAPFEETLL